MSQSVEKTRAKKEGGGFSRRDGSLQYGPGTKTLSPASQMLYNNASSALAAPGVVERCALSTGTRGLKYVLKKAAKASSSALSPEKLFG